ncbi:MAG: hypothetical protein LBG87_01505 [Spirochaetaceae bacterium]|jgi:hypothetical protein|nr:hypothetical protein [Spirochaetaceae bacterium]
MIGFLIKKTFFDLWDNLFRIALINLGFIASAAIPIFIPSLLQGIPLLSMAVFGAGVLWCVIYLAGASLCLKSISDYGAFGFGDFFSKLKEAWLPGLGMGGLLCLIAILGYVAIPFYLGMSPLIGLLLAAVIFWTMIISILAFQFFFPIRARLDRNLLKVIKKCFLIFFDNPLFCVFSFLYSLATLAVSTFLAFLVPGPAGMLLYLDEALRLRLLKYDWLEANPDANRRKIPWDALLIEEREKTGVRSLRNFIFPWKD